MPFRFPLTETFLKANRFRVFRKLMFAKNQNKWAGGGAYLS